MIRCGLAILAAGLFLTCPSEAPRAQGVEEIEQAWRGWMEKTRRTRGGLAVVHAGQPVREAGAGGLSPVTAVPYASLSKAITGVCVATLIESGKLAFETPVSQSGADSVAHGETGRSTRPAGDRLRTAGASRGLRSGRWQ